MKYNLNVFDADGKFVSFTLETPVLFTFAETNNNLEV